MEDWKADAAFQRRRRLDKGRWIKSQKRLWSMSRWHVHYHQGGEPKEEKEEEKKSDGIKHFRVLFRQEARTRVS